MNRESGLQEKQVPRAYEVLQLSWVGEEGVESRKYVSECALVT